MCTKFGMVLMLLVLLEVVGWMINRECPDKIVILALSPTVWPNSFMPGLPDIVFRPCTSIVASSFEAKRWRFAPFSTIGFLEKLLQCMVNGIATLKDTLRIFWHQKHQPEIHRQHSAEFGGLGCCSSYYIFNPQPWDPNLEACSYSTITN